MSSGLLSRCSLLLTTGCLIITAMTGCGGSAGEDVILDPLHLIDNFDKNPPRHHPRKLVELSVGRFAVKRFVNDGTQSLELQFDAYIVIPKRAVPELEERLQARQQRVRDRIQFVVGQIELDEVSDPNLTWIKSELIPVLNRVLQSDDVRDVVLGDISVSVG